MSIRSTRFFQFFEFLSPWLWRPKAADSLVSRLFLTPFRPDETAPKATEFCKNELTNGTAVTFGQLAIHSSLCLSLNMGNTIARATGCGSADDEDEEICAELSSAEESRQFIPLLHNIIEPF